jgi:hypothetical protein
VRLILLLTPLVAKRWRRIARSDYEAAARRLFKQLSYKCPAETILRLRRGSEILIKMPADGLETCASNSVPNPLPVSPKLTRWRAHLAAHSGRLAPNRPPDRHRPHDALGPRGDLGGSQSAASEELGRLEGVGEAGRGRLGLRRTIRRE